MPPKKSPTASRGNKETDFVSEVTDDESQSRQQADLSESLMTILTFLEKRDEIKERQRREEEERRQEEMERKEERRQQNYRAEADERERRLLALLESKEKAHLVRLIEKSKKLKSIPTWKDNDTPADFLRRFEQVMKCNGEPKEQWARLLSLHLTGKASTVFNTRIPLDKQDNYDAVKTILLDAFGDTVDLARQQWWTLRKASNESFQDCMIRIEEKFKRGLEGCETHFDYVSTLSLSFYSTCRLPYICSREKSPGWNDCRTPG